MIHIRRIEDPDWDTTWSIVQTVVARGDTYPYSPDLGKDEAYRLWVEAPMATYVALYRGEVVGTYYIKPNQPGLGAHVCNCGYMVSENARGQGVATALCEHSQQEALALGFKAMQFNLVVSTNTVAVRLWSRLGYETIGTLPGAFRHKTLGYVDALVMYKWLAAFAGLEKQG